MLDGLLLSASLVQIFEVRESAAGGILDILAMEKIFKNEDPRCCFSFQPKIVAALPFTIIQI